jgi:hypothetical protein
MACPLAGGSGNPTGASLGDRAPLGEQRQLGRGFLQERLVY